MRYLFYKVGLWIRDSRRTGYLRPILLTAGATAAFILLFRIAEHRLFPGLTLWQSRISIMLFSSVLACAAGWHGMARRKAWRRLFSQALDRQSMGRD